MSIFSISTEVVNKFFKTKTKFVETVKMLREVIGHDNWFISGGAAVSYSKPAKHIPFNDIDIFFYTEEDYNTALNNFKDCILTKPLYGVFNHTNFRSTSESELAVSFSFNSLFVIQFIKVNFGDFNTIFDTFDLSVCKVAVTPELKVIKGKLSDSLYITRLNNQTFMRYFKYMDRLEFSKSRKKYLVDALISNYITDSTILSDPYYKDMKDTPVNVALYDVISKCYTEYLDNKTRDIIIKQAPELLL